MKSWLLYLFTFTAIQSSLGQDTSRLQQYSRRLVKAYPDCITGIRDNYVLFKDGTRLLFDDGRQKTLAELYAHPDIEDQLRAVYVKGETGTPAEGDDPGRIRNDAFFKTMYGATPAAVQQNFEKHGFIWGGKWYHYDTMHFEYRPELLE